MKVTPEMMAKFEQCQSAEEVMELAKKENISITMDQACKAFELLSSEDLTDEMMEKISGGGRWLPSRDRIITPCSLQCRQC